MTSLEKIVIKSHLENQFKPPFINPICMKTYELLPKIYGHIKLKKNHHKHKKLLLEQTNVSICSPNQKNIKLIESSAQTKQYFCCKEKIKAQENKKNMKETFQSIFKKKYENQLLQNDEKTVDKQLQCRCKSKSKGKISSLSLQNNKLKNFNKGEYNQTMRKNKLIQIKKQLFNSKFSMQQDSQTNHKVKSNLQQKQVFQSNNYKKNQGLFSLIRQVSQKNQLMSNMQRTRSQGLNTPLKLTHQKSHSLCMAEIQEQQQFKKGNIYKFNLKNKVQQKKNKIGKNIKINKQDIQIKASFSKKNYTQPNQQKMLFYEDELYQNKVKQSQKFGQKKYFCIPSSSQISSYLKTYKPILQNFNIHQIIKSPNFSIIYDQQGRYVYAGQIKDELTHGRGIKISKFSIFQGEFNKGKKKFGVQITNDGIYKGSFKNQKRQGQGIFKWNNGQIFEGKWQNNVKQGFGKWKSLKGDEYQGNWSLNKQNGYGIFKCRLSVYKGNFKDFLKHGQGQQIFKNGDKYIGEYKQGKPSGKGIYYWQDGQIYQGQFINGLRQGKGILKGANGQFYKGQFKKDFKHGIGIIKEVDKQPIQGIFQFGTLNKNAPIKKTLSNKK